MIFPSKFGKALPYKVLSRPQPESAEYCPISGTRERGKYSSRVVHRDSSRYKTRYAKR